MHNKLSIIIPSRGEIFLIRTIQDILEKAKGDIEIIAVLDGEWPVEQSREHWHTPQIIEDKRVTYLYNGTSLGMRASIRDAVSLSTGKYILKCDGHVMFDEGFDVKLLETIEDDWIVIPRRKRLDAEKWEVLDVDKPDVDYEYIGSPNYDGAKGQIWTKRILERLDKPEYMIDENMTFQGSCWMMSRNHWDRIGGMPEEGYGTFVREAQQLCLTTWLMGGKVMTNKNTWYAHLHKGKVYGRGYYLDKRAMIAGEKYCDDFWYNNRLKGAKYDMAWLIERFGGVDVPTWTIEQIEKVRAK